MCSQVNVMYDYVLYLFSFIESVVYASHGSVQTLGASHHPVQRKNERLKRLLNYKRPQLQSSFGFMDFALVEQSFLFNTDHINLYL